MAPDTDLLAAFDAIRCWGSGGQRAPHKPLLLLMALARIQRGEDRWLPFSEIEDPLRGLLSEFGPPRQASHPEYPFWRLVNDGLWEVEGDGPIAVTQAGDATVSTLRGTHARGAFRPEVYSRLAGDPELVNQLAARLLEHSFPPSLHEAILEAVGFPWVQAGRKRRPSFRDDILRAYERRCAVCGYDGRLGSTDLAIEAAHVMWHAAGGPDTVDNGLALCSFHHVAFDRGAFSIDESHRLLVSQDVHGQTRVDELLLAHTGRELRRPQAGASAPGATFTAWHRREVFRSPARSAA